MRDSPALPYYILAILAGLVAVAAWAFGMFVLAVGACAAVAFVLWQASTYSDTPHPSGETVLQLGPLKWNLEELCTHWLIAMRSGHGKTNGLLRTMLAQVFRTIPNLGMLAIDQKGNFNEILIKLCKAAGIQKRLLVLRVRRPGRDVSLLIEHTTNLIGDRSIPWETYAQIVIDVAVTCGQETTNPFFKNQGHKMLATTFATLEAIGITPTLADAYDFISGPGVYDQAIQALQVEAGNDPKAKDLLAYWEAFQGKAREELSGIKSTAELYLYPYSVKELREVFSSETPNVTIADLDKGMIICPSVPQAFLSQRNYITNWYKVVTYYHLLLRYDTMAERPRGTLNPIILIADEGQNSLLCGEGGLADYNALDKIREALGCVILTMQSPTSALPALKGKTDLADTIYTNLNNKVIGKIADEPGREMAAKVFGRQYVDDVSFSYQHARLPSSNVRQDYRYKYPPEYFGRLKRFHCLISHVEGGVAPVYLPPLDDAGKKYSMKERVLRDPRYSWLFGKAALR